MALAKIKNAVLLTGDVKMHFAQKKLVGGIRVQSGKIVLTGFSMS